MPIPETINYSPKSLRKISKEINAGLTYTEQDISNAVMLECSCGGGGPEDRHTCPACKVYHRLVTYRHNAPDQVYGANNQKPI